MMNKSLNKAFIKAYSKEKASDANRQSTAAARNPSEDAFIVRFDTATCLISPHPLMLNKLPRTGVEAAQVAPKSMLRDLPAGEPLELRSSQARLAADELRDTIALQMSKAGAWEDQQIDAFIGGFPMISPFHVPIPTPHFAQSTEQKSAVAIDQWDLNRKSQAAAQPAAPEPANDIRYEPDSSVGAGQEPSRRDVIEPVVGPSLFNLEPPLTPALQSSLESNSSPPERRVSSDQRASSEQRVSSEQRLKGRNKKGEIFRLDRPSYSSQGAAMDDGENSDSDEQSSLAAVLSSSFTNMDIESVTPPPVAPSPKISKSENQSVKSVERDLRQARIRVFNPVWEVDSFQWPVVCLELLEQRAESMEKVAQNLIGACREGLQVLAVTSPQGGEGRTTVACCLAKLAGSHGLNVAIVDGDIENPTLSYQTNLDVEQDWKTAIFNQLPLEEIAVHSIDDQVTLVPLVNPIGQNEMSPNDNRIAFMLQELSDSFDLVIVDMGHMNSTRSLVTTLSEQGIISAVVAVVDHRCSSPQQIENCLRRIRQTGVASIGLVENFAA